MVRAVRTATGWRAQAGRLRPRAPMAFACSDFASAWPGSRHDHGRRGLFGNCSQRNHRSPDDHWASRAVQHGSHPADRRSPHQHDPLDGPGAISVIAGMPPVVNAANVYSEAGRQRVLAAVAGAKSYVYVPSAEQNGAGVGRRDRSGDDEGRRPRSRPARSRQHVVPSWDLKTLYVTASAANQLVPIDPTTGKPGTPIPVDAALQPVLLARRHHGRRPGRAATTASTTTTPTRGSELKSVPSTCNGNNHADWSADGTLLPRHVRVLRRPAEGRHGHGRHHHQDPPPNGARCPRTCGSRPDGSKFYVADMMSDGVWIVDGNDDDGHRPHRHRRRRPRDLPESRRHAACTCPTVAVTWATRTASRAPATVRCR